MSDPAPLVLVTGISGFIAKHVARELLEAGYRVRGTVRSPAKGEATRETLRRTGCDVSGLEFVTADLASDPGWDEAVAGCHFVQHTASPFPMSQPHDKMALVPTARDGTLRVVEAAKRAGVERLVLTSSVVAVYHGHDDRVGSRFTEADFSNVEARSISAYSVSKTLAERAAWDSIADSALELAVINPSLVLGPLLDREAGTSTKLILAMMRGRFPAVPGVKFGVVDVRDVARAHVAAMTRPQAAGHRFIVTAGQRTLREIADAVAKAYPGFRSRLPRFTIPDAPIRLAARVSRRAASLAAELDRERVLDNGAAKIGLGLSFIGPEEAAVQTASSLLEFGLVERPAS